MHKNQRIRIHQAVKDVAPAVARPWISFILGETVHEP
jgi:hypothetical protein